ncbi:polysaccharide biosynthesis/export family protein [Limibacter armeniacum]|uniref:polysaccharide biosynthesis/export family protein n=1 Tax=Limibacter armeniacum TaxID=466084 RepID=UPI002FE668CD
MLVTSVLFNACTFKQSILFKTNNDINPNAFEFSVNQATQNYLVDCNDHLAISVFTNKGERLIDPNKEFQVSAPLTNVSQSNRNQQLQQNREDFNSITQLPIMENSATPSVYVVDGEGYVNLPLIGRKQVKGLTLNEVDDLLASEYKQYYLEPFVISQYVNKRVLVMGALGEKVVPIRNENMTVIEVITIVGGVLQNGKANNIRHIRPDPVEGFKQASVQVIDLTTIDGLRKANINVSPNDVIYIEPRRKLDSQNLRDVTSIIGAVTSSITGVVSLYLLINQIGN